MTANNSANCSSVIPLARARSGVGRYAIAAIVIDADRYVDQFLGQRIQGPGRHNLLDVLPYALQGRGMIG